MRDSQLCALIAVLFFISATFHEIIGAILCGIASLYFLHHGGKVRKEEDKKSNDGSTI